MSDPVRLGDMLGEARREAYDRATPAQRKAYDAASSTRRVFSAWNDVMEHERGRDHVTGLYYAAEDRRLVVYVDGPAWCQELSMMREVLRTRVSFKGVELSSIDFRVSREGYRRDPSLKRGEPTMSPDASKTAPLGRAEREGIRRSVSGVEDDRLREALEKAMVASFEWKKGQEGVRKP